MQTFKRIIEEPKYRLSVVNNLSVEEFVQMYAGGNEMVILHNDNNTGSRTLRENFLDCPCVALESMDDIKALMTKHKKFKYMVISFYQENGYVGVYTNGSEDALIKRPSNWVHGGSDSFVYLVLYNSDFEIDGFLADLSTVINEGIYFVEVIDEENDGEPTDDIWWNIGGASRDVWEEQMIAKYGFTKKDFEEAY